MFPVIMIVDVMQLRFHARVSSPIMTSDLDSIRIAVHN